MCHQDMLLDSNYLLNIFVLTRTTHHTYKYVTAPLRTPQPQQGSNPVAPVLDQNPPDPYNKIQQFLTLTTQKNPFSVVDITYQASFSALLETPPNLPQLLIRTVHTNQRNHQQQQCASTCASPTAAHTPSS